MPCEPNKLHLSFRKPSCTATLFLMFLKIPRHRNDYCLLNYSKLKSLKGSDTREYISFTLTLTSDRCFGNEENRNPYTMNAHKSRKLYLKEKALHPSIAFSELTNAVLLSAAEIGKYFRRLSVRAEVLK